MDTNFAVPALWIPSGTHQRRLVASVQTITFGPNEQGVFIQTLTANVRVTIDSATDPKIGANDVGFELRSTDPAILFTGAPGMQVRILQVAATAIVQYQMLTLSGRYA